MELLIQLTLLCAVMFASSLATGEKDDIVVVSDKEPSKIGENHKLTCKMKKRTSLLQWMKGNDVILQSYRDKCYLNPAYVGQCNYSCDPEKDIFELTILNITVNYDEEKLVCSNGINKGCKRLYVVDKELRLEETEKGITAKSACCYGNVTFKWKKIDAAGNKTEFTPIALRKFQTYCSIGECGQNSRKYIETFSAASNGSGEKYFVKMEMIYRTESIESVQTRYAYLIEDQVEIDTKLENSGDEINTKLEKSEDERGYLAFIGIMAIPAAAAAVILRKRAMRCHSPTDNIELEQQAALNADNGTGMSQGELEANIAGEREVWNQTEDGDMSGSTDNGSGMSQGELEENIAEEREVWNQTEDGDMSDSTDTGTCMYQSKEINVKLA